jgi:hypothetical protein
LEQDYSTGKKASEPTDHHDFAAALGVMEELVLGFDANNKKLLATQPELPKTYLLEML